MPKHRATTPSKNSSRLSVRASSRNKGGIIQIPATTAPAANNPIRSSAVNTAMPINSKGRSRAGNTASISPSARSWTTNIPSMIWPWGVSVSLRSIKHLSTTAVEDKDKIAPRNTPWAGELTQPTKSDTNAVTDIVRTIWIPPPPKLIAWTFLISEKENSTPKANNKKATPNWARVSTWINSLISPSPAGPTTIPPSRYPSKTGWRHSAANSPPPAATASTRTKSTISLKSSCTIS